MRRSADRVSMRALPILLIGLLGTGGLRATDITGEWTAEIEGRRGGSAEITMNLKEEDRVVSGTVRAAHGAAAISSGNIDHDTISFSVITEVDGYRFTQYYRGVIQGDIIHFTLTIEGDRVRSSPIRDFDAKRIN